MKKLEKMSLANVTSKLTRKEMSNIMAGSTHGGYCGGSCILFNGRYNTSGTCATFYAGGSLCHCVSGSHYSNTCRGN